MSAFEAEAGDPTSEPEAHFGRFTKSHGRCFVLGFAIAVRWGWRWSVGLFVAFEAFLLFWIRDNILLNALMLVWPLEAIRQWQTAIAH